MQIIRFDQHADHAQFLSMRRGTVGGSDAKANMPLKRGSDRRPAGLWQLIAGKLFTEPDGEKPRDRGLRVEAEGARYVIQKYGLVADEAPGMWVSEKDKDLHATPDAAEKGDKPTWAIENKALDSNNHIMAIVKDLEARKEDNYNPLNSLCISSKIDFRYQAKTYFVVNPDMDTLYFNLHDDRASKDVLMNYTIIIKRSDIPEEDLEAHEGALLDSIKQARNTIRFILKELEELAF